MNEELGVAASILDGLASVAEAARLDLGRAGLHANELLRVSESYRAEADRLRSGGRP